LYSEASNDGKLPRAVTFAKFTSGSVRLIAKRYSQFSKVKNEIWICVMYADKLCVDGQSVVSVGAQRPVDPPALTKLGRRAYTLEFYLKNPMNQPEEAGHVNS
jgi:hypothetical protein